MNQKVEYVRQGKQKKLANPCELRKHETTTYMVGCPSCKQCPFFVKEIIKEDGKYIHCDHTKANQNAITQ